MNKKLTFTLLIFSLLILTSLPQASAYFTKDHIYWDLKLLDEVDSPIVDLCTGASDGVDRTLMVVSGETVADVPVLHYFDNQFKSYIATHTRSIGYENCLQKAGTDPDLQCTCYGIGLHNVEDHFAHTEGGLVPKYLRSSFLPNLLGHMMVEQSYLNQHQAWLVSKQDLIVTSGQLDLYNSIVLDNYFVQTGGDIKYVKLINEVTALDITNDLNIFANGYKNKGFFDTVYNPTTSVSQGVRLPAWFFGVIWGTLIGGLMLTLFFTFIVIKYGRMRWGIFFLLPFILIFIFGAVTAYAYYTHNTWGIVTAFISIPNNLGLLTISQADIEGYDAKILTAGREFLETGQMPFEDNSGLSYCKKIGTGGLCEEEVDGALIAAEKSFTFILLPVLTILIILWVVGFGYLTFKSVKGKRKKR